ncbi:MAG: TIGR03067 domain-containing protein [Zavarzinella sp.]
MYRITFLVLLCTCGLNFGAEPKTTELQGIWKVTHGVGPDGAELPKAALEKARLTFDKNLFIFQGGPILMQTTFEADESRKEIDLAPPKGEVATLRGIYRLNGNKLTLTLSAGKDRPTQLIIQPGVMVLEMIRD